MHRAFQPVVHPDWHLIHPADHLDAQLLELLRVPRESEDRRWLPLIAPHQAAEKNLPFYKQVARLSLLYLGSLIMLAAATALMMELVHGAFCQLGP